MRYEGYRKKNVGYENKFFREIVSKIIKLLSVIYNTNLHRFFYKYVGLCIYYYDIILTTLFFIYLKKL